jgi:8-oxo-dGTP diphosphatase/2-hydroxy-dATP diphosphatase
MIRKLLTLCIPIRGDEILLGMKKRGFGAGKWNGFGGKVEPGETLEAAAKRETVEDCGIVIQTMQEVGWHEFVFLDKPDETLEVHVYRVESFLNEPEESEEMRPKWFPINAIPFEDMWPDDRYWFPWFLKRQKFHGKFHFDHDGKLVQQHIESLIS